MASPTVNIERQAERERLAEEQNQQHRDEFLLALENENSRLYNKYVRHTLDKRQNSSADDTGAYPCAWVIPPRQDRVIAKQKAQQAVTMADGSNTANVDAESTLGELGTWTMNNGDRKLSSRIGRTPREPRTTIQPKQRKGGRRTYGKRRFIVASKQNMQADVAKALKHAAIKSVASAATRLDQALGIATSSPPTTVLRK